MSLTVNLEHHLETHHASKLASKIKQVVYGSCDGVISTFAIIAASIGSGVDNKRVIILAIANVIADGLSMGFSDFISSYSEIRFINAERKKEEAEFENNREYEKEELATVYMKDGMSREDAVALVSILEQYPVIFMDHMMFKELDLTVPEDMKSIIKSALITFISFLFYGSIPIISYVIVFYAGIIDQIVNFGITCGVTVLTLFMIGAFEGHITKQNILYSGFLIALNGSIATATAFGIGYGLESIKF
jgi:vacuolar iron transporter family protein